MGRETGVGERGGAEDTKPEAHKHFIVPVHSRWGRPNMQRASWGTSGCDRVAGRSTERPAGLQGHSNSVVLT